MALEYKSVMLEVGPNMQAEAQAMDAEGWQIVPGTKPVMVYHLYRDTAALRPAQEAPKGVQAPYMGGAMGRLVIDEAGVKVIKAEDQPKPQMGIDVGIVKAADLPKEPGQ